jgi:predicted dehydrogenase
MPDRVRVGVVGTSWFAETLHLAALGSHPGASVTAICGRNRERAAEVATDHNIPHVFTDYRDMFASGLVDAVVVVSPDSTHYPATMAALGAGLHVMCEKPLALSADQAREMYDTAKAAGLITLVGFTWRWVPPFNYVHHLIQNGLCRALPSCPFPVSARRLFRSLLQVAARPGPEQRDPRQSGLPHDRSGSLVRR